MKGHFALAVNATALVAVLATEAQPAFLDPIRGDDELLKEGQEANLLTTKLTNDEDNARAPETFRFFQQLAKAYPFGVFSSAVSAPPTFSQHQNFPILSNAIPSSSQEPVISHAFAGSLPITGDLYDQSYVEPPYGVINHASIPSSDPTKLTYVIPPGYFSDLQSEYGALNALNVLPRSVGHGGLSDYVSATLAYDQLLNDADSTTALATGASAAAAAAEIVPNVFGLAVGGQALGPVLGFPSEVGLRTAGVAASSEPIFYEQPSEHEPSVSDANPAFETVDEAVTAATVNQISEPGVSFAPPMINEFDEFDEQATSTDLLTDGPLSFGLGSNDVNGFNDVYPDDPENALDTPSIDGYHLNLAAAVTASFQVQADIESPVIGATDELDQEGENEMVVEMGREADQDTVWLFSDGDEPLESNSATLRTNSATISLVKSPFVLGWKEEASAMPAGSHLFESDDTAMDDFIESTTEVDSSAAAAAVIVATGRKAATMTYADEFLAGSSDDLSLEAESEDELFDDMRTLKNLDSAVSNAVDFGAHKLVEPPSAMNILASPDTLDYDVLTFIGLRSQDAVTLLQEIPDFQISKIQPKKGVEAKAEEESSSSTALGAATLGRTSPAMDPLDNDHGSVAFQLETQNLRGAESAVTASLKKEIVCTSEEALGHESSKACHDFHHDAVIESPLTPPGKVEDTEEIVGGLHHSKQNKMLQGDGFYDLAFFLDSLFLKENNNLNIDSATVKGSIDDAISNDVTTGWASKGDLEDKRKAKLRSMAIIMHALKRYAAVEEGEISTSEPNKNALWSANTIYEILNPTFPASTKFVIDLPELCEVSRSGSRPVQALFVFISAPREFELRQLHRDLSYTIPDTFRRLFLLGHAIKNAGYRTRCDRGDKCERDIETDSKVQAESDKYNDILVMDFQDTYQSLSYKSMAMLRWKNTRCADAAFLVKMDIDIFPNYKVFERRFEEYAKKRGGAHGIWRGTPMTGVAMRSRCRNSVLKEEYPNKRYPWYNSGPHYWMSRDVAESLGAMSERIPFFPVEDALLGICGHLLGYKAQWDKLASTVSNKDFCKRAWVERDDKQFEEVLKAFEERCI